MRRPGKLRHLGPPWFIFSLNASGRGLVHAETGKRLQSQARTRAGYYLLSEALE